MALILDVDAGGTVDNVKTIVNNMIHVPKERMGLVFEGKYLENSKSLSDYNINVGADLELTWVYPRRSHTTCDDVHGIPLEERMQQDEEEWHRLQRVELHERLRRHEEQEEQEE